MEINQGTCTRWTEPETPSPAEIIDEGGRYTYVYVLSGGMDGVSLYMSNIHLFLRRQSLRRRAKGMIEVLPSFSILAVPYSPAVFSYLLFEHLQPPRSAHVSSSPLLHGRGDFAGP